MGSTYAPEYTVHIKCDETDEKTYEKMKSNDESTFCLKCSEELFPFSPSNKNITKHSLNIYR